MLKKFLKQLQGEKTRRDIYLYSIFVNKQEAIWDVEVENNSGNNGSEMIEFIIFKKHNNDSKLQWAGLHLLRNLFGKLPLEIALKGKKICLEPTDLS